MNPIVRDIYNAKVEFEFPDDEECMATLEYAGWKYFGFADLHPDDKEFYSKIVGTNIALSRARQSALYNALEIAKIQLNAKKEMYWQATNGVEVTVFSDPPDPYGRFFKALTRAENNVKELRAALRTEKRELNHYLSNQDLAIRKLKRNRAEKAEDN